MAAAEPRSPTRVTISLGVLTVPPPGVSTRPVEARIRQVDDARVRLYRRHFTQGEDPGEHGRNRAPHPWGFPSGAVPGAAAGAGACRGDYPSASGGPAFVPARATRAERKASGRARCGRQLSNLRATA